MFNVIIVNERIKLTIAVTTVQQLRAHCQRVLLWVIRTNVTKDLRYEVFLKLLDS